MRQKTKNMIGKTRQDGEKGWSRGAGEDNGSAHIFTAMPDVDRNQSTGGRRKKIMPILGGRRMPCLFFAEINILRSADAVESKFIHDVPDTLFSLSWSGGREIEGEYGADIDRRTGLHSSSVTPDQSHHHPFHTRSPLCSCPPLSGLQSGSNAIGL